LLYVTLILSGPRDTLNLQIDTICPHISFYYFKNIKGDNMQPVSTSVNHIYKMTINGELINTPEHIKVINPATGEHFSSAPKAGIQELELAIHSANLAFPKWRRTPHEERCEILTAAANSLRDNADRLAEIFTKEQGRPFAFAKEEIKLAGKWLKEIGRYVPQIEITEDTDSHRVEVHREPLGVVGAIVPWNFPVLLAVWKISHALITGNTMYPPNNALYW
jgi:acyl-CoA reductase-like NAD-dependent aldehyde dehydrogenase